eukprot:Amastigsp_a513183_18.p3 type:complete len:142 gc:universal Amastigsp_a513183_18:1620-1195(-)
MTPWTKRNRGNSSIADSSARAPSSPISLKRTSRDSSSGKSRRAAASATAPEHVIRFSARPRHRRRLALASASESVSTPSSPIKQPVRSNVVRAGVRISASATTAAPSARMMPCARESDRNRGETPTRAPSPATECACDDAK